MLLGSVSQAVLQHVACPVAVVHPHQTPSVQRLPAGPRRPAITPDELSDLKELS